MNKYIKLILTYVIAAILIVILYSPSFLALRPTDPGIIRPGFAIIFAILILALLVWRTWVILRSDKHEYIIAGQNDSAATIQRVLSRYVNNPISGQSARSGLDELSSSQRKRKNLETILDAKFEKGSLSYDKFMGAVDMAVSTIEKNTALLANRIQAFDDIEYRQLAATINSGQYKMDNIPDSIQEEKARLYISQVNEMNNIVQANETLLLELDRFSTEISQVDAAASNEANDAMIAELKQLTQETQYYKSVL